MKHLHDDSPCPLCGGRKHPGRTTYTADLASALVVVRNVPAMICSLCGEQWIDSPTAADLERITDVARAKGHQIEVLAL